jgi:hypothetical protein
MHEALKFARFSKEQMGVEVFMLAGWLDEKGNVKKAKWVPDACACKSVRLILSMFTPGFRHLDLSAGASRNNSTKLAAWFGRSGTNIWVRHGMVSKRSQFKAGDVLTRIQIRQKRGLLLMKRRCLPGKQQTLVFHGICQQIMRDGPFSLWSSTCHFHNWRRFYGHF